MIYTAGDIGADTVITATDFSGRILWQQTNGESWTGSQPGSRGTPTIDGDRLYHESPHGDVVCLHAQTGKQIWGLNILQKFRGENIDWALAESLLIDGERLICCPGGPETAVVALDKMTGSTVWKSPSAGDKAGYASPVLAEFRGVRMILTLTSHAVIGVQADTGELLWRFEHQTPFNENITMPLYHDGHVFVSTRTTGSVMLKLATENGKVSVSPVWRSTELDNQHGGVVLADGYLYGSSHVRNNAKWICLQWETGRLMYAERGAGRGSLTYADGMLYTLSERGIVGLVPATPTRLQIASQFPIPKNGRGPSWAHPVVCDGRLFIRHGDFLYAYDVRAGE
jgi:outer membrane protein assembly factor BamB